MASFKCGYCKLCKSSKSSLKTHIAVHKKRLNKDIINYGKFIEILNWGVGESILQTWDTKNVIKKKKIHLLMKTHLQYMYIDKINDADLNTAINKRIRNTFGISNNNGNFIGIMFKTSDYDESDGFVVDDVFVDLR